MDLIAVAGVASAVSGAAVTVVTAWPRMRGRPWRVGGQARQGRLRQPQGNRVAGLGVYGSVVETGGQAGGGGANAAQ